MHWADKVAKKIIDSGEFRPYWVDDMKTPSGFAHVGSLRGPIVHSLIHRALKDQRVEAKFTFVINDFDPVDGLSADIKDEFSKYLGFPLKNAPSPIAGFNSMADCYSTDFINALKSLGVEAEILSSWEMYHEGKFNEAIKTALDNSEKIQDIYQKVSGSKKREKGWLPLQVICEKCGKLGTTRVYEWDGEMVSYKCEPEMVSWAVGCGHEGKISPFDGKGKLPWKVDWPAHWKVIGITIEGAGKDHASAGGSYDIARQLCSEVFDYPQPFKLPIEFFLIGGKKMSSSKGLGFKAHDLVEFLPNSVARFLFARTDYREHVNFDPVGTMVIPDLFDEYDRCYQAYINDSDETLSRTFILSQISKLPDKKKVFLPRFRDVANYIQLPNINLVNKFEETKGSKLTKLELEILKEREKYAKVWLERYAPDDVKSQMVDSIPESAKRLNNSQKEYLMEVINLLERNLSADDLQKELYGLSKTMKLEPKSAFAAIYQVFIGKDYGPRAGAFLLSYGKEKVIERLKEASK